MPLLWVTFVARLMVCLSLLAAWWICRPPWWVAPILLFPASLAVWWGSMSAVVTLLVAVAVARRSGVAVAGAAALRIWPWYLGFALLIAGERKPALVSAAAFFGLNGVGLLLPGVALDGAVRAFSHSAVYVEDLFNLSVLLPIGLVVAGLFALASRRWPGLFRWSVLPALWLSPAVWLHYLTVLAVPLGKGHRRQTRSVNYAGSHDVSENQRVPNG